MGEWSILVRHPASELLLLDYHPYSCSIGLWDIGGGEDYDRLRPLVRVCAVQRLTVAPELPSDGCVYRVLQCHQSGIIQQLNRKVAARGESPLSVYVRLIALCARA